MKIALKEYINDVIKKDKFFICVSIMFILFNISSCIYFSVKGQVRNAIMGAAWTLAPFAVVLIEYALKVHFTPIFLTMMYFIMVGGGMLGPCYDFYFLILSFDDILHCVAGLFFGLVGYCIADSILKRRNMESFALCFFCGACFTLAIASLWEMFEFFGTAVLGYDMQEDSIVHGFGSFFLSGSHNEIVNVDGITQTIIYYGNGQTITIDGYLDIGLEDTLNDILMCTIGCLVYVIIIPVTHKFASKVFKALIPQFSIAVNRLI